MFGQYLQFFASTDAPCKRKAYYVIEVAFNTIKSIITYHTQEWNKDQRDFGHCPGHSEVALGSLSNSLAKTGCCMKICSLLCALFPKMIHLLLCVYGTGIEVVTS